jgi:hypothetical protein
MKPNKNIMSHEGISWMYIPPISNTNSKAYQILWRNLNIALLPVLIFMKLDMSISFYLRPSQWRTS